MYLKKGMKFTMKKENGIKETYMKEIYLNVLKAIIIVLYFFILNVSYENVQREHLLIVIKAKFI